MNIASKGDKYCIYGLNLGENRELMFLVKIEWRHFTVITCTEYDCTVLFLFYNICPLYNAVAR